MFQSHQFARPAPLARGVSLRASRIESLRFGFTLAELLIVIAIISVLAAMSVSLLSSASNDAKISATQARLSQITAMLQLQMEDYEVRRLPIPNRILSQYIAVNPIMVGGSAMNPRLQLKYLRRQLLMALIDSEMPRPVRTVNNGSLFVPVEYEENGDAGKFGSPSNLNPTSIYAGGAVKNIDNMNSPAFFGDPAPSFRAWVIANYDVGVILRAGDPAVMLSDLMTNVTSGGAVKWQRQVLTNDNLDLPGEYPYEILRSIQIDGQSAVETLGNSAIDNSDGLYPSVVDAWGDPLIFDLEQFGATVDTTDNSVRSNDTGVVPLDPRYPMALGDLRIVVGSSRIPESLPVVERISQGVE